MEKEKNKAYEEPRVELFGIMEEGVICGSPVPPGGIETGEEGDELQEIWKEEYQSLFQFIYLDFFYFPAIL